MQESEYFKMFGPIEACVVVGDLLWCSAYDFNLFFSIDLMSNRLQNVSEIPGEEKNVRRLYGSIVHNDGKLYLIPMAARELAIYDIRNGNFEKIRFREQDEEKTMYKSGYKFCGGVVYGSGLLMLSCSYPGFVSLNLEDYSLEYRSEWVKDLEALSRKREEVYFRSFFTDDNKSVIMPSCCTNYVMQYDIESGKYLLIETGDKTFSFSDAVMTGDKLVLSSKTGEELYLFDMGSHEMKTVYESGNGVPSVCMLSEDGAVYIIPNKLSHIITFIDGEITESEFLNDNGSSIVVLKGALWKGAIYMIPRGSEKMVAFDTARREFDFVDISFDRSAKSFFLKRINSSLFFKEGKITLDDFISCMW